MAFTQDAGTAGKKKKSVDQIRKEIQELKNRNAQAYANRKKTGGKYEPLLKRKSSGTGASEKNYTVAPNGQKVFKRSKTGTPQPTNPNLKKQEDNIPTYEGTNQKKYNIWNGEKHYVRMKKVGGEGKDFMSENEKNKAAASVINQRRGASMRQDDLNTFATNAKKEQDKKAAYKDLIDQAGKEKKPDLHVDSYDSTTGKRTNREVRREGKEPTVSSVVSGAGEGLKNNQSKQQTTNQQPRQSNNLKGKNQSKKKKSGGKKQAKLITSSSAGGNAKGKVYKTKGKDTKAVIKAGFEQGKKPSKKKGKKKKG